MNGWLSIDPRGLQKNSSVEKAISELAQNGLDTDATEISISIEPDGRGTARVRVTDNDPSGYADLSHSWTMFAPSTKAEDDSKRGIFNVGEKEFLAFCVEGTIKTMSGSVTFPKDAARKTSGRVKTTVGSEHDFIMRMNRDEQEKTIARLREILLDGTQTVSLNGEALEARPALKECVIELPLMRTAADDPYRFILRWRKVKLTLHKSGGAGPKLHVIGMPVQPIEGRYSVNVHGRLKLDQARDQVTDKVLAKVMAAIANMLAEDGDLTESDVEAWAGKTLGDHSTDTATRSIVTAQYGDDVMVADPSHPAATSEAVAEGRRVIWSRSMGGEARAAMNRVRSSDPTFAPVTSSQYGEKYGTAPSEVVSESEWTDDARRVVAYAKEAFRLVYGRTLGVEIFESERATIAAQMSDSGMMSINLTILGWDWFRPENREAIQALLIHEIAHYGAGGGRDHTKPWGEEACRVGAKLAVAGKLVHDREAAVA